MISKRAFAEETARQIKTYLPPEYRDMECTVMEVPKNNGVVRTGIGCCKEGEAVSPVIYLDSYYEGVRQGGSLEDVMGRIAEEIRAGWESREPIKEIDLTDYKSVAEHLGLMLVNTRANRKMLSQMPHIEMEDLSGIACVEFPASKGCGRVKVTEELLRCWGKSEEELLDTALSNMEKEAGLMLRPMDDILDEGLFGSPAGENLLNDSGEISDPGTGIGNLYVLTNQDWSYGAAALCSPAVRQRIGERFPKGVYLLPSSVHEVLLVPKSIPVSPAELGAMVREINREEVLKEEVLSDRIYEYDKESGTIRSVPESLEKRREWER